MLVQRPWHAARTACPRGRDCYRTMTSDPTASGYLTSSLPALAGAGLASTIARVKERLVVQPRPDALGVATVAFLPLMQACGLDVFDQNDLRGTVGDSRMLFRVRLSDATAVVEVHAVGNSLAQPASAYDVIDGGFTVRTNGADWQLLARGEDPYPFSLYDDVFPSVIARLFQVGGPDVERRVALARTLLQQDWLAGKLARLSREIGRDGLRRLLGGTNARPDRVLDALRERRLLRERRNLDPRAVQRAIQLTLQATGADPSGISLADEVTVDDVLRHAETVANLQGRLHVRFDGVTLPVTSRNGLYLVLAALAVQLGREDAVPSDDLVTPPALVPPGLRARPLGPTGWHLLLVREPSALAEAVAALIEALGLEGRIEAFQTGQPYPESERARR